MTRLAADADKPAAPPRRARLVREWLDSPAGPALIIAGMTHRDWDMQLTAYAARDWRANFWPVASRTRSWAAPGLEQCGAERTHSAPPPAAPSWSAGYCR